MTALTPDAFLDLLHACLATLLPVGAQGGIRRIAVGDERFLSPVEQTGREQAVAKVRQASGAARSIARELCARLGHPVSEIPRLRSGAPGWPPGVVGSMAHDATLAVAVAALPGSLHGIGVDIEPHVPLEDTLVPMVASEAERQAIEAGQGTAKELFCIKEAVFKAVHPHDGVFLEFHDVKVNFSAGTAQTSYGRTVSWRVIQVPHVLAVAWW